MPLAFPPDPGTVVICHFPLAGSVAGAEMVKTRPAIVVSRLLEGRRGLVCVVPVSMTPPAQVRRWHVRLPADAMPRGWADKTGDRWAKCDMLTTVSLDRLSMRGSARRSGRRRFETGALDGDSMREIRKALAYILELF
ncbi:MAG: type II toxin-antitoxin system PemK/MazF family toxin [Luteibacter sp.]